MRGGARGSQFRRLSLQPEAEQTRPEQLQARDQGERETAGLKLRQVHGNRPRESAGQVHRHLQQPHPGPDQPGHQGVPITRYFRMIKWCNVNGCQQNSHFSEEYNAEVDSKCPGTIRSLKNSNAFMEIRGKWSSSYKLSRSVRCDPSSVSCVNCLILFTGRRQTCGLTPTASPPPRWRSRRGRCGRGCHPGP